ncbi:metalloprotease [Candidatus Woesearchaeota archaeon]|nr:metalloprotease [Candidatus Woesearchaeota archaeon]
MPVNAISIGPFTTSKEEIRDIIKAWIAVTLVFSIFLGSELGYAAIIISLISVGLGVVLHEVAHKIVAQHYGCVAEFRAFNFMLLLGILLSFLGFVFLAPGAVFISGPVGKRRNGRISAAGPLTNIVLSMIFYLLIAVPYPLLGQIAKYGVWINGWLALFNMIPLGPLDGRKILHWNKIVFGLMLIASLVIVYKVA